jgi:hypothetical protein
MDLVSTVLCRFLSLAALALLCWLFPAAVDFSEVADDEDVLWQEQHRETRQEIQARGRLFLEQVMARPEMHIAVSASQPV